MPARLLHAARLLVSDTIGDPAKLLGQFDSVVAVLAKHEPQLPEMRQTEAIITASPKGHDTPTRDFGADEERVHQYRRAVYSLMSMVDLSLPTLQRAGARELFLALLQQYELPTKTRKVIEAASKFFAKTRTKRTPKLEALDAYEKMLALYRGMSAAAHEAISTGRPHGGAEGTEKVKAGPFALRNTGGFKPVVIDACARVVEEAARLLEAKGLGMVCYGDVLVSNTLSRQNVLAFYMIQNDELFVRANLRGQESAAVHTVVHELGHRLSHKFLHASQREIQHMYDVIARAEAKGLREVLNEVWSDPEDKPKIGDNVTGTHGEYTISGYDVGNRGQIIIRLVSKADPKQTAHTSLENYVRMKGLLPREGGGIPGGFVSQYASTNAQENFAEMVSHYCSGTLAPEQVEMLRGILP